MSNRGKSKTRMIKSKPKCRFPVRKKGTKAVTIKRDVVIEITPPKKC